MVGHGLYYGGVEAFVPLLLVLRGVSHDVLCTTGRVVPQEEPLDGPRRGLELPEGVRRPYSAAGAAGRRVAAARRPYQGRPAVG